MSDEQKEIWYRYEETHYSHANEFGDHSYSTTEVHLREYTVTKRTPKGVWLSLWGGSFSRDVDRFVLRDSRKRFACPTIDEARASFIARKQKEIRIYKARIEGVERALRALEKLERRAA